MTITRWSGWYALLGKNTIHRPLKYKSEIRSRTTTINASAGKRSHEIEIRESLVICKEKVEDEDAPNFTESSTETASISKSTSGSEPANESESAEKEADTVTSAAETHPLPASKPRQTEDDRSNDLDSDGAISGLDLESEQPNYSAQICEISAEAAQRLAACLDQEEPT